MMMQDIHPTASIGTGTKIWSLTYIGARARIGKDCTIGSLCHIDRDVMIGDRTRVQGCVYLPERTVIGEDCFIGPGVVVANERYPPSEKRAGVSIEHHAVIGAGVRLGAGVRIGHHSIIGLGSVVTRDVPANTVAFGVPARPVYSRETYDEKKILWEAIAK